MNSHDNFLLVRIFERLASLDRILRLGRNSRASRQTGNIASHDWAEISDGDLFYLPLCFTDCSSRQFQQCHPHCVRLRYGLLLIGQPHGPMPDDGIHHKKYL